MTRGTRGGVRAVLARWRGRDIELKTPGEIDAMRVAGALVARALAAVTTAARGLSPPGAPPARAAPPPGPPPRRRPGPG